MRQLFKATLPVVLLGAASAPHALAADYDPPLVIEEVPQYRPVEIGSGWYLRGDVGYNFERKYRDVELSVGSFDSDTFNSFEVFGADLSQGVMSGSVGFGYHFNDLIRSDLEFGFLSRDTFDMTEIVSGGCSGTRVVSTETENPDGSTTSTRSESAAFSDCSASVSIENQAWNAMVNTYVDLGTVSGFTPYLGAGIGVAYTPHEITASAICSGSETVSDDGTTVTTNTFLCDGQTAASDPDVDYLGVEYKNRQFSLAYSLSAGFAYQMGQNTKLDFGYRYFSAPKAQYITTTDTGWAVNEGQDYHQVRLGLRYDLW